MDKLLLAFKALDKVLLAATEAELREFEAATRGQDHASDFPGIHRLITLDLDSEEGQ